MKRLVPFLALVLASCASPQHINELEAQVAELQQEQAEYRLLRAYLGYDVALQNVVDFASSDHATGHMANTIDAMADLAESAELVNATDYADKFTVCKMPTRHAIPDRDCDKVDFSQGQIAVITKALEGGAFKLRQGLYSIKDMHGLPTNVDEEVIHDAH